MNFWEDGYVKHPVHGRPGPRQRVGAAGFALLLIGLAVLMVTPFFLDVKPVTEGGAIPALAGEGDHAALAIGQAFTQAAERVLPAVVSIISHADVPDGEAAMPRQSGYGLGSGIIFDRVGDKAYVATNHHVVSDGARLEVVLTDGSRREAALVGSDLFSDLAVLAMDGSGIDRVVKFGDSGKLEVGEFVIAIGNPLGLSYSHTTTAGIISSLRTPVPISLSFGQVDWEMELIQTDAAINRGNSGGALVNLAGEVIGINSMKVSDFGVEGLGFAIPINDASEIIGQLLEHGRVPRPFLGVAARDLQLVNREQMAKDLPAEVKDGVYVVSAEGPAAAAGLAEGDVIVRFDDTPIGSSLALRKYLYGEKAIGETILIGFYRGDARHEAEAVLGERE